MKNAQATPRKTKVDTVTLSTNTRSIDTVHQGTVERDTLASLATNVEFEGYITYLGTSTTIIQ